MYDVYIVGGVMGGVAVRTFETQREAISYADALAIRLADDVENGRIAIGIEDESGNLIEW